MSESVGQTPEVAAEENEEQIVTETDEAENEDNAYAYLDRDHFTSEKFKIVVRNLPKFYGMPELKKLLNKKLNLEVNKVKKPQSKFSDYVYVCFRSDEARDAALKTLNGYKWKGKALRAEVSLAAPDPLVVKRKAAAEEGWEAGGKKLKPEDLGDLVEKLKDSATPLWRHTYEEQLGIKTQEVRKILAKLSQQLLNVGDIDMKKWIHGQKKKYDGLPCELLPIRPSPIVDGYRNKCEFTIGINEATGEKTVGMRVSSYAKGSLCVVSPDQLPHVSDVMKKACAVAETFIRESPLDVYNQETHEGYWATLTVRYGFRTKQLMVMFALRPQQLTAAQLAEIADQLRAFYQSEKAKGQVVHSLLLVAQGRGAQDVLNLSLVDGEKFIYEEICGYKFRISPKSFFQINTPAAEVLYNSIGELSGLTTDSALIDICCGAGTIGICLAKQAGEVLGLELSEESVQDAKQNAKENNIRNAEFFAGPAEDILSAVIRRTARTKIVAVVDPPRAGLEKNAIRQLRRTEKLEEFVYASCNPAQALKNFIDFGRHCSKQYPGDAFVPIRCVPVDMFPHSEGCELVIFFQRFSKATGAERPACRGSESDEIRKKENVTENTEKSEENES